MGCLFYAAHRVGAPRVLLVPFAAWVVSPFVILGVGYIMSPRWSALTRATLYCLTPVVMVASLAIYGAAAFGASRPKTAIFVIVAPASWCLIAIAFATAAFLSRRSRTRG